MAEFKDTYRDFILPLLAVAETIGTKGRSPGTVAMSQQDILRKAEETKKAEERAAREEALQNELRGYQIGEYKGKESTREREQKKADEEAARRVLEDEATGKELTELSRVKGLIDYAQGKPGDIKPELFRENQPIDLGIRGEQSPFALSPLARKTPQQIIAESDIAQGVTPHAKEFKSFIKETYPIVNKEQNDKEEKENKRKESLFIREASKDYTTSSPYRQMDETTNFGKGVHTGYKNNSATGDLIMIKSLEKTLQPESSVMQGESDAYQTAGTILDRISNSGYYALVAKGKGRLPPDIRETIVSLSSDLYNNRRESFDAFRAAQVIKGIEDYGFDPERAHRVYSDIPKISGIENKDVRPPLSSFEE